MNHAEREARVTDLDDIRWTNDFARDHRTVEFDPVGGPQVDDLDVIGDVEPGMLARGKRILQPHLAGAVAAHDVRPARQGKLPPCPRPLNDGGDSDGRSLRRSELLRRGQHADQGPRPNGAVAQGCPRVKEAAGLLGQGQSPVRREIRDGRSLRVGELEVTRDIPDRGRGVRRDEQVPRRRTRALELDLDLHALALLRTGALFPEFRRVWATFGNFSTGRSSLKRSPRTEKSRPSRLRRVTPRLTSDFAFLQLSQ